MTLARGTRLGPYEIVASLGDAYGTRHSTYSAQSDPTIAPP